MVLAVVAEASEPSLAQALAEKSLVDEFSDDSATLGESQADTDTEALMALVDNYKSANTDNFVSFMANELPGQDTSAADEPRRYMRHLDTSMVITTASNKRDQKDAAFMIRTPLCPPGDAVKGCPVLPTGAITCFSLESVNYVGKFLSQEVGGNKVELRQPAGGQETMQTVCVRNGLLDSSELTLEFMSAESKLISNRNSLLRLCSGADDNAEGCGTPTKEEFNMFATFKRMQGTFVGTCTTAEDGSEECGCVDGFLGSHCNVQCPGSAELGVCQGHGACALNERRQEAQCTCTFGWVGDSCAEGCPMYNDAPCGGLTSGNCYQHPVTGPSCKCKSTFLGTKCQLMCPGSSEGVPCSGHGKCTTDEDESKAECTCSRGWLGASCDRECPVLNGHLCGGYGQCKLDEFGGATCTCEDGRHGNDCGLLCPRNIEGLVCSGNGACVTVEGAAACACEDGFLGNSCERQCPGLIEGRACSGHGTCDIGQDEEIGEVAECTCDETHGGKDCLLDCPADEEGNVCSGHGSCGEGGKCDCNEGFLGDVCQHGCYINSEDSSVCSGHGTCLEPASGETKATCDCDNGFMGSGCQSACPMGDGLICSSHGKCEYDAIASQSRCKCTDGFMGDSCQFTCPGLHNTDIVCSGHGQCALYPDVTNPVAAKCTQCLNGFVGPDCSLRCPGLGDDGVSCSGHGHCQRDDDSAVCQCLEGYKGAGCDIQCPMDDAGNLCGTDGECMVAGDKAFCKCNENAMGDACEHKCPRNTKDDKICSDRGICNLSVDGDRAVCQCSPGSVGDSCDAGCPMGENTLPCSGHGACNLELNDGKCKCDEGWTNDDCSHPICTATTAVFNKVTAQCVCPKGNVCCEPDEVQAKRAKEVKIRKLRAENKELSAMLSETKQMLSTQRR